MAAVTFRFYEELNDFLRPDQRKREFGHVLTHRTSLKDLIESLGVPHTEIEVILVNGESVGFERLVEDGDRIAVYPMFEALDITPLLRLRERPLRDPRFALDVQLGALARYLRLCGFDALYRNDWADEELARRAVADRRVLLTRDRELLKRRVITHGYYVRADRPRAQLEEVCQRLDLWNAIEPYRRCTLCNGLLEAVDKETVIDLLPSRTRRCFDDFKRCASCGHVYWRGSHVERMEELLAGLRR
jgi:uncharacterized protein with PIN domain/sulfur carrier protein ThiS